ncbi:hypothetical protein Calkro_0942 [Caldicellulosiruptor kronotskyensis 2002]|uniref:Uncharacterized protein n=1 Tax=Caldicellulosiruptor kronotskyensis (strain DSM 18902 / VKM B-2412 / 2002) TaxID=632348 RepID=E4SDR3_CALK2|nr:hypothetical protein Calkro_0942 [Caldicellulosiruptor kronotskyensis 2002]
MRILNAYISYTAKFLGSVGFLFIIQKKRVKINLEYYFSCGEGKLLYEKGIDSR